MHTLREAESAALERESLERQRRDAERELARVAREAEAIEAERRAGARLAEHRDTLHDELRRQEDVLKQELERLGAEVMELDAERVETAVREESRPTADETERAAETREALAQVACDVSLQPQFRERLESERYPGNRRVNYGDATITVSYVVDPRGATVDGDILVVPERSVANNPEYFEVLSEDTVGVVKDWTFTVETTDAGQACSGAQRRMVTFTYRQKCVGRPMPSCRTVQSGVSFLEAAG